MNVLYGLVNKDWTQTDYNCHENCITNQFIKMYLLIIDAVRNLLLFAKPCHKMSKQQISLALINNRTDDGAAFLCGVQND